jgi:hypothetical protein
MCACCCPTKVKLNGEELTFTRGKNYYRIGAAVIPMSKAREHLKEGINRLIVYLG